MRSNHTVVLLLAVVTSLPACTQKSLSAAAPSSRSEEINFLSIIVDPDTFAADTRLKRFLEKAVADGSTTDSLHTPVRFQQQMMPYGDLIRAFVEPDPSRGYLARITPYAYVVAEMLGAKLNILAVYKSEATESTTYHAYFVVRKDLFYEKLNRPADSSENKDVSVEDVVKYLKQFDGTPARFVYHDRFSTSSYFMPSLYFKAHDVFAMTTSLNPHLIPIDVQRYASTSSSALVKQVRDKQADLAAVWDRTTKQFKDDADLVFIKIPTEVPNDFLVASGISDETQRLIVGAIKKEPGAGRLCTNIHDLRSASINPAATPVRPQCADVEEKLRPRDDFDSWYAWESNDSEVTDVAREALARLRQDARQRPMPVVVRIEGKHTNADADALMAAYIDAAKEAVRLSGTEFVLEDRDLHRRVDMTWTLQSTHDGALQLTSRLASAFGPSNETFSISFVDSHDLPRRIADLARSRLRRIRYVWPYELKYPAVLRDVDFTPDRQVLVQKISWIDPERNEYEEDTPFVAQIENNTDFSKLRLSDETKFPRNPDGTFNFDPMSNVAYRVVVAREPRPGWIWVALPHAFIGLFMLACVGLAIDLRRRQPPPKGLLQTYQRMVETYHRPWRAQEIEEGDILWCDAKYVDEFVKELKSAGSFVDLLRAGDWDFNIGPVPVKLSLIMKLRAVLLRRRPELSAELVEAVGVGSAAALDSLIQFLVRRHRLSPFVGFPERAAGASRQPALPIEWEALNDITARHFQQLGISEKRVDAQLSSENNALSAVVSQHFRGVIKKAGRDASLFRRNGRSAARRATRAC